MLFLVLTAKNSDLKHRPNSTFHNSLTDLTFLA
jgi:hypothetical protein